MKYIPALLILLFLVSGFIGPVSPNLTAEYDSRKRIVMMKWQNSADGVSTYVIQRSEDNKIWKDIYTLESTRFNKKKLEKFSDIHPDPAKNYYRLKIKMLSGLIEYTPSIMVIIGNPVNSWVMYPVPVRDVINLQYNGSEAISGVINIFIQNMYGNIIIRRRFSSLGRNIRIPVDNLGRGTYDIRIVINEDVVWNQRFIK